MIDRQKEPAHTQDEFDRFCEEYYGPILDRYEHAETVVSKWPRESLVPDFSDFDGRIIASDDIDRSTWADVDQMCGQIHKEMIEQHPEWVRILEHTPGIGIRWTEIYNERLYQPETHHWGYFLGEQDEFRRLRQWLDDHSWEERDEYYYLGRFFYYYSPYIHGIDPPTNMDALADRYAVHSRILHYCVPALQAALSLIRKSPVRDKMETIRGWMELRPDDSLFDSFLEKIRAGYRCKEVGDENSLRVLEEECWQRLQEAMQLLPDVVTVIDMKDGAGFEAWKKRLDAFPENPLLTIFNGVRFARIRRGRYWCYLNVPEYFDVSFLIPNEFTWLKRWFTESIFRSYGRLKCDLEELDLDRILEAMQPEVVDKEGARVVREVFQIAFADYAKGAEAEALLNVMDVFPTYEVVLEDLLEDALRFQATTERK